jgi:hypothetical protein
MAADRSQVSDGLYMTVEQYLALDESSDAKCQEPLAQAEGLVTSPDGPLPEAA